ncbi:MAG: hypothetical protein ABI700_07620 [Chloroflexota bacterium]
MNNQGTEKRVWVEPTLTHINAAETLGGTVTKYPESVVFTLTDGTVLAGVSTP